MKVLAVDKEQNKNKKPTKNKNKTPLHMALDIQFLS
jgi:hypothetical protein